jgi:hypothetical protein
MSKTIFWSWQSDRDERVARHLIREALVIALKQLSGGVDIEDRLEIDHDTRGLPGSPDIVMAILEKIDAADVFVADVTPIVVSEKGKHIANPNVLIELGYAKKSIGKERWITVWNTAFTDCRVEDLPFDLRGRRGPVAYSLRPGATKHELGQARTLLVNQFVDRIGACLDSLPAPPVRSLDWQPSALDDPSIWSAGAKPITINERFGSGIKELVSGGRWYVRLLPSVFNPSAMDNEGYAVPAISGGGFSWGNTTGGIITYSGSVRADNPGKELAGATMWFRNTGEVWATHTGISGDYQGRPCFYGDYVPEKWANIIWYGLNSLAKNGGMGPYHVRLGVTGLEGLHWSSDNMYGGEPPKALEPSMEVAFTVTGFEHDAWKDDFINAWATLRRVFSRQPPEEVEVDETLQKCR